MDGNAVDEVPSSSSKQTKETREKVNSETMNSSINDAESANDVNSAKVAAMKDAELVNKNLVGFGGVGYLSLTKRKSHFGVTKRRALTEESSSCWDFRLFSNQECQEKFNRLMDVKGNAAAEHRSDTKHVNLRVKKSMPIWKTNIPLGFGEEMVELGL